MFCPKVKPILRGCLTHYHIRYYSPLPRRSNPIIRRPRPIQSKPYDILQDDYQSSCNILPRPSNSTEAELKLSDNAYRILSEPSIAIHRERNFTNGALSMYVEQPTNYTILNARGELIGRIQEQGSTIFNLAIGQVFGVHRPYEVAVLDLEDNVVLRIKRSFSLINSYVKVSVPNYPFNKYYDDTPKFSILGECMQSFHVWRRKYELFDYNENKDEYKQFGMINSGFIAYKFNILDQEEKVLSMIYRYFEGIGIEVFASFGTYIIRFDKNHILNDPYFPIDGQLSNEELTLSQRAVILANAVSIDFDYFANHVRT